MKKRLPILLVLLLLVVTLAGCPFPGTPNNPTEGTPTDGPGESEPVITVDSVEISGATDGEEVFDGSNVRLSAEVKGSQDGLKVSWSSSDESLATVVNGVVKFGSVTEDKQVTITATSKDDATKSDSITFNVKHCVINLAASRGNNDSSLLMSEGIIVSEVDPNTALVYSDVYGTKWYVEAEIIVDAQSESDDYPKFGIMTGTSEDAVWNGSTPELVNKNLFFYNDQIRGEASKGWASFNVVGQNAEHTDWAWGAQIGPFSVAADDKVQMGTPYRMGLLRDGVNYYMFYAAEGQEMVCYKHVVYKDIAACEASYAWLGGWNTGVTVGAFKALIGDAADEMYSSISSIELGADVPLYIGTTHQLTPVADVVNHNLRNLVYTSSNPEVATVDENGLVTAQVIEGTQEVVITVACGEITDSVVVVVTDDQYLNVVVDGLMNDPLWNDTVKENVFVFNKADAEVLINLYGSRNSKGIYFFVEYKVLALHESGDWWCADNFEMRIMDANGLVVNSKEAIEQNKHQFWISTANGNTSNMSEFVITAPKFNEDNQYYEFNYEIFIPYTDISVEKDALLGFNIGANPGGNGWYSSVGDIMQNKLQNALKITSDGVLRYYPESHCGEEHTYNDWVVETNPSCVADGLKARYCVWCNHKESEVLPMGEHSYNTADVTVVTESTCSTHGVGTVACVAECGTTTEVSLPLNPGKHSAWDATAGSCSACGSNLENGALYDRYNAGGWDNVNNWYMLAEGLEGDFSITIDYNVQVNVGFDPNNWWEGCLFVVAEDLPDGTEGYGSPWVTRHDWFGWCDQWQSDSLLGSYAPDANHRNDWWCGEDGYDNVVQNMDLKLTVTRTGTTIRLEFAVTAMNGDIAGHTYSYWHQLNDVALNKHVNLAFTSEFAKATIYSVVRN